MKRLALASFLFLWSCANEPNDASQPFEPMEPPPPGTGFQVDEGEFTVDPGIEELYCMRLPIPESYESDPVFVTGAEWQLPEMTHHFFMAYKNEPVDEPSRCADQEGNAHVGDGKIMFLAGVGHYGYQLLPGYGLMLDTGAGQLQTSHHVINFNGDPVDMFGRFNIYTAPAQDVIQPVNVLNCLLRDIWVAPGSSASVSATCTAPFDLEMVTLGTHAHQFLKRVELRFFDGATTHENPIYVSTDWDSPDIEILEQPLALNQGQGLTITCHYQNGSDQWVTYGAGDYGEMCAIMSSYAYPTDRPYDVPPSLGALIFTEGSAVELVDTSDIGGQF